MLNLPPVPGVYLFKDGRGGVLYVGKARSLAHRVRSYLSGDNGHPRLRELMERAVDLDTIFTETEVDALLLEASLIRQHHPHFNVLLKDDKTFPFVRISMQEEFPRVSVTRQVRRDGARYLGPYTDVRLLRRTLREIRRIFPLRSCKDFEAYRRTNRPCLYYHIRRCAGPCTTRAGVDPAEYRAMAEGLILFLSGRDGELLTRLRREMEEAAGARAFERAARRRDQIRLLEGARVPPLSVQRDIRDTDVVGLARAGQRAAVATLVMRGGRVVGKTSRIIERAEGREDATLIASVLAQEYLHREDLPRRIVVGTAPDDVDVTAAALSRRAAHRIELVVPQRGPARRMLRTAERNAAHALEDIEARAGGRRARFSADVLELQRVLGLPVPPHRMVCFDISNLGPEGAVAAVVAGEDGRPRKSLYRRMRIRRPGPDDFAMIGEAVGRYWARVASEELPRPDLVLVDGGVGQVRAARAALEAASPTPVPLAGLAKREEAVVREDGTSLRLPRRSGALRMLQRLRDEAHRFGLAYHRKLRHRARIGSALDGVPGVGPARRAALLKAFGSVDAVAAAAPEEIAKRAHVPQALALRIADHLGHGGAQRAGGRA